MRSLARRIFLILSSTLLFSSVQARTPGVLLIDVKSLDGAAVRGACVTIVPRSGAPVFRKADGKGRVKLADLPAGKYRITAKSEGFELEKKEVEIGDNGAEVEFRLHSLSLR
jgi:hypothetical protein